MRYHYRITKYNPAFRNADGSYQKEEWTSYSDIGRVFEGKTLSKTNYLETEAAYLFAVSTFMSEANISTFTVRGLERSASRSSVPAFVTEGAELNLSQCVEFSRLALREVLWARLVRPGRAYIHFGYDYYMYIGRNSRCASAITQVESRGLFVEPCRSPYLRSRSNNPVQRTVGQLRCPPAADLSR